MFTDPSGEAVYFTRRIDGTESLFRLRPEQPEQPVFSAPQALRAWRAGGVIVAASPWPRRPGGLRLQLIDMDGKPVAELEGMTLEPQPLPQAAREALRGQRLAVPGMSPLAGTPDDHGPAAHVLDGLAGTSRIVPLTCLPRHGLPVALVAQPGGARLWLTSADACSLHVLDASTLEPAGEVQWAENARGLARVAFRPATEEVWVAVAGRVLVVHTGTLQTMAELHIEETRRWHRGGTIAASVGGLAFTPDGGRLLVARPFRGDVTVVDPRTRREVRAIPLALDGLELLVAGSRCFVQGMRNGAVGWFALEHAG